MKLDLRLFLIIHLPSKTKFFKVYYVFLITLLYYYQPASLTGAVGQVTRTQKSTIAFVPHWKVKYVEKSAVGAHSMWP